MTGLAALAALAGAGLAGGLVLLIVAVRGLPRQPAPLARTEGARSALGRLRLRAGLAAGAALAVALVIRWPVAVVLAGALGWAWPSLFAAGRSAAATIERIEAIATWTEMLRGMTVSAASIEQAIMATVPRTPTAIRGEIEELAGRLRVGEPLVAALRPLAEAIDDDVGDLVVGALLLASDPSQKAGGLARQLDELARRARHKAGYRLRVQSGRARIHASARAIMLITLGVVAALLVFGRAFLAPYATPIGQLMLLGVGGLFAVGLALLARLGRLRATERFLAATPSRWGAKP